MQIRDDITDLSVIPPFRHRADDRNDPLMSALREGHPVKLVEEQGFNAAQMRRLAKRLTDRARRRGFKQTRSTTREAGRLVIAVQWYREVPGDLIGYTAPPPAYLRLLRPEAR